MLILALDTSSAGGSVAVVRAGAADDPRATATTLVERGGRSDRTHAERLPAELIAILAEAGASLDEIDRLAVAVGPGSFTGLRIGIAAVQGLALARGIPVAAVSTFDALAWHGAGSADGIATWVEAHRGEVFAMLFARDGRAVLAPATALRPEATLDAWRAVLDPLARVRFLGDGAHRYRDLIAGRLGAQAAIDGDVPLLAGTIGRIAAAEPARAGHPHALVPLYVRRPDVELARERRQGAAGS